MRRQRIRAIAAITTLVAMSVVPFAFSTPAGATTPGQVVITEWMYNPTLSSAAEFVELTNIGGETVDMATYSFDDDSRTSGSFSLAGIGTLAPGESGLIVEKTAAAFRTDWGLPDSVKIADLNTNNLGRADEINIFNGSTLADRLTYDDQTKFPGSIRTVGTSGVPSTCLALGANNVGAWVFSVVGDANGTKTSASGDIGSPGTTTLGSVWAGHDRRRQRHGQCELVAVPARITVRHRSRPRRSADVAGQRDGCGGGPVLCLEDRDRA